jgi:RNA polymerase sigma-70 factor (ECF subfamily)
MEMNLKMKGPTRLHFPAPVAAGGRDFGDGDVRDATDLSDASDVRTIYRAHARFVWLSLQRLGVQPSDLDDVAQDVFVIVHRRLDTFDRTSRITTWLFGICLRVAANYRRRRRWTRELLTGWVEDNRPATLVAADEVLVRREEREIAERALDRLDVAKRATFVMFEIESLSCLEIAEIMNVPLGTVYSRLHSARRELEKTMARELKRRERAR